jgi:hypothetical protein
MGRKRVPNVQQYDGASRVPGPWVVLYGPDDPDDPRGLNADDITKRGIPEGWAHRVLAIMPLDEFNEMMSRED